MVVINRFAYSAQMTTSSNLMDALQRWLYTIWMAQLAESQPRLWHATDTQLYATVFSLSFESINYSSQQDVSFSLFTTHFWWGKTRGRGSKQPSRNTFAIIYLCVFLANDVQCVNFGARRTLLVSLRCGIPSNEIWRLYQGNWNA